MARLTDLSVSFISLVDVPATGKGLVLKSAKPGETAKTFAIAKMDDERMVAYGIVYSPDQEDSHGDFADADTIRRAAYHFMRDARTQAVDRQHSFNEESAYVAESWLVQKADAVFPAEPVGSWAVGIQIGDPDLWKQLKSGDLTGISLAGIARVEPDPGDDPQRFVEKLKELLFPPRAKSAQHSETDDMDKAELSALVKKEVGDALKSGVADVVKAALADALKSAGDPPSDPPAAPATPPADPPADPPAPADPPTPPADPPASAIEKAMKSGFAELEKSLDTKIAKALASGETETEIVKSEGSFL